MRELPVGDLAAGAAIQAFEDAEASVQGRPPHTIVVGTYSTYVSDALDRVTRLGRLLSAPLDQRTSTHDFRSCSEFGQEAQREVDKLVRLRMFLEDVYIAATNAGFFNSSAERIAVIAMHFGELLTFTGVRPTLPNKARIMQALCKKLEDIFHDEEQRLIRAADDVQAPADAPAPALDETAPMSAVDPSGSEPPHGNAPHSFGDSNDGSPSNTGHFGDRPQ